MLPVTVSTLALFENIASRVFKPNIMQVYVCVCVLCVCVYVCMYTYTCSCARAPPLCALRSQWFSVHTSDSILAVALVIEQEVLLPTELSLQSPRIILLNLLLELPSSRLKCLLY